MYVYLYIYIRERRRGGVSPLEIAGKTSTLHERLAFYTMHFSNSW